MINSVYYCSLENITWQQLKKYIVLVSTEEEQHIISLRSDQDKCLSLAGKILLFQALKKQCQWKEDKLPKLSYTNYKRPFLPELPIDFNISHSGNLVVCSVSEKGRTGIDIEQIKPVDFFDYKEVFSVAEFNDINTAPNSLAVFYSYWTVKEAVMKADGRGFFLNPLEIEMNTNRLIIADTEWFISYLPVNSDYSCCAVFDSPEKPMVRALCLDTMQFGEILK